MLFHIDTDGLCSLIETDLKNANEMQMKHSASIWWVVMAGDG